MKNTKRQIDIHHLYYAIGISIIVIIFIIICVPAHVDPNAFTNFSFAATITSIVLAVVSIVYSIISGSNTSRQMTSMHEIESRIGQELHRFRGIEKRISTKLQNTNESLTQIAKGQTEIGNKIDNWSSAFDSPLSEVRTTETDNNEVSTPRYLYDYPHSKMGYIIIYCFCLSYETQKPLPTDLFAKEAPWGNGYAFGYTTALSSIFEKDIEISKETSISKIYITKYNSESMGDKSALYKAVRIAIKDNSNLEAFFCKIQEYYTVL